MDPAVMPVLETGPYVRGWLDCAETIANLLEIEIRDLEKRRGLRDRLSNPPVIATLRHAAELARAVTVVDRGAPGAAEGAGHG